MEILQDSHFTEISLYGVGPMMKLGDKGIKLLSNALLKNTSVTRLVLTGMKKVRGRG